MSPRGVGALGMATSLARPRGDDARDAEGIVRQAARRGRSGWLKHRHVDALVTGRGPVGWSLRGSDTFWWRLRVASRAGLGCRISADEARDLLNAEA